MPAAISKAKETTNTDKRVPNKHDLALPDQNQPAWFTVPESEMRAGSTTQPQAQEFDDSYPSQLQG